MLREGLLYYYNLQDVLFLFSFRLFCGDESKAMRRGKRRRQRAMENRGRGYDENNSLLTRTTLYKRVMTRTTLNKRVAVGSTNLDFALKGGKKSNSCK